MVKSWQNAGDCVNVVVLVPPVVAGLIDTAPAAQRTVLASLVQSMVTEEAPVFVLPPPRTRGESFHCWVWLEFGVIVKPSVPMVSNTSSFVDETTVTLEVTDRPVAATKVPSGVV